LLVVAEFISLVSNNWLILNCEKFDLIFKPVLEKLEYTPIRADKINIRIKKESSG